jgi:predicted dithiol-disulfide oxidoreductase (DUF899 family)
MHLTTGGVAMDSHAVVSRAEWLDARKELLDDEKEFTRLRDQLSERRRHLPWVRVDKAYAFEGPSGPETLADLFGGRSQLVVYHFMFDPDWQAGCKSCSFWADNFDGIVSHLEQRDVSFVAISRAPLTKLAAFAKRLGWSFKWVSSRDSDFNFDYGVSFTAENIASGQISYNYTSFKAHGPEMPGISVFSRDRDGGLYHTYSCYARGLDMLNTAYHYLDLVPKGRDEADLPYTMSWVRLHDEYAR